jgi:hypothetical protein
MESFVSWSDYEGLSGFGATSMEEVQQLQKALVAGQDVNNPGTSAGAGFPLRTESLENTLKVVTYKLDEVKLWQNITKLPAYNTVEEFNRLESYGSGIGAFISEGDLPESDDSTYSRQTAVVKYLAVTRSVSHVMSLIRPAHGSVIAQETVNGTAWLLKQLEKALFLGDSTLIPVEFDGLKRQITTGAPTPSLNLIDMRGLSLTEDVLNDACLIVKSGPNYGRATDLYLADGAYADLAKSFYPSERFQIPPGGWTGGMVGMNIQGFFSQFGPIRFNPSTFIEFGALSTNTPAAGPAAKRPSTPTESVAPAAGAHASSEFVASDAGDYNYSVHAINRYGRSAALAMTGPVTVAAGDRVTMTVADGATAGTAFEIYRSSKDGAAATNRYMFTQARSGATTQLIDYNSYLPGTSWAYLIQQNLEYFSWKQLTPHFKIPLATIDTSIRWVQGVYGTPTIYAPGKSLLIKNIGRAPGSSGLV